MNHCVSCAGCIIGVPKTAGNFKTQVASNLVMSLGICLVLFSSWQYTQNPPACCHWPPDPHNTSSTVFPAASPGSSGGSNCSAIHVDDVVDGVNFHLPPNLSLTLAIVGLMVKKTLHRCWVPYHFSSDCVTFPSCLLLGTALPMPFRVSLLLISFLREQ